MTLHRTHPRAVRRGAALLALASAGFPLMAQTVATPTHPADAPPVAAEHEITPAETEAARAGMPTAPPATPPPAVDDAASTAPATPPASNDAERATPAPADGAATATPAQADPSAPATPAPSDATAPASSAADAAPPPVSRGEAYAEFRRLFDGRQYEQALVPARQVVALTEQQASSDDLEVALMNLAATESLAADTTGAEATYLRVIELIEGGGTRSSARLARANAGLAVVYHEQKRHELAVARFDQALALTRRHEGLFDEAQLPLIDKFTDSLTAMQKLEQAHTAQRYGLRIVERKYGRDSAEIAPRLEVLARWYTRVGAYDAARLTLRRAITLVERKLGPNSVELIGPLTALAENYRRPLLSPEDGGFEADPSSNPNNAFNTIPGQQDGSVWRLPSALATEGERALERALAIAENQPQPEPARIADVQTQLGDWYQTRLQHEKALPHYQAAWTAARQVKAGDSTLADALFSRPVLLHYVRPSEWDRYERRPPEEVSPHTVEIEMTVTAEGRVRNAEVVANDGTPRMGEATLDAAETARFRPRMIDGKPSETADVRFAQTYFEPIPVATPEPAAGAGKAG